MTRSKKEVGKELKQKKAEFELIKTSLETQEHMCPITFDIMRHPVKLDGDSSKRSALLQWGRVRQTSPLTGEPCVINEDTIRPDQDYIAAMEEDFPIVREIRQLTREVTQLQLQSERRSGEYNSRTWASLYKPAQTTQQSNHVTSNSTGYIYDAGPY